MLYDLIRFTAKKTGLSDSQARQALGILFNTAERQGASMVQVVFDHVPGARLLSTSTGIQTGAATGPIAQLIEQTPGGRRHMAMTMFSRFHEIGLGHEQVSRLLGCVGTYMKKTHKVDGIGHLGDLVAVDAAHEGVPHRAVA